MVLLSLSVCNHYSSILFVNYLTALAHFLRKLQADRVDVLPWKRSFLFAHCWFVDWLFGHALSSLRASPSSQLFRSSPFICVLFFDFRSRSCRIRSNCVLFRVSRCLAPPQQNSRQLLRPRHAPSRCGSARSLRQAVLSRHKQRLPHILSRRKAHASDRSLHGRSFQLLLVHCARQHASIPL